MQQVLAWKLILIGVSGIYQSGVINLELSIILELLLTFPPYTAIGNKKMSKREKNMF